MHSNILCRVCATTETASVLVDIFDKPREQACVAEMILELAGITVTAADGLPQDCCIQCYTELLKGVSVRRKCIETDKSIRTAIESSIRVIKNSPSIDAHSILPIIEKEKDMLSIFPIEKEENITSLRSIEQEEPEAEGSSTDTASINEEEQDKRTHLLIDAGAKLRSFLNFQIEQKEKLFRCNECCADLRGPKSLKQHYECCHANAIHGWESFGISPISLFDSTDEEEEDDDDAFYFCEKEIRPVPRPKPKSPECNFLCCGCKEVFDTKAELQQHSEKVHAPNANFQDDQKPYQCNVCYQFYANKKGLLSHQRTQRAMRFLCTVCGQRCSSLCIVKYHEESLHMNRTHPCPDCGKGFFTKKSLQIHQKTMHTDPQKRPRYVCDICGTKVLALSTLKKHREAQHSDETPFACNLCDARFKRKARLKGHMVIHQRLFPCLECGRAFPCESAFKLHMGSHAGIRSNCCALCPAKFRHKHSLSKHMKTVHDPNFVRKRKYGMRNVKTRAQMGDPSVSATTT